MDGVKQNNVGFLRYVKASVIFASIGIAATLILLFAASYVFTKCDHYETVYPLMSIALKCLPAFISARIAAKNYRRSLLPNALSQSVTVFCLMLIVSLAVNGINVGVKSLPMSYLTILTASVIAVIIPIKKHKHS